MTVKKYRKIHVKKFLLIFIFQRFYENWRLFLPIFLKFKSSYFQGTTLFFWIKIRGFLKQKIENFGPNKTTFSFSLKINFRKMASNKHVDLRKIENFVRSKENRTNFRKPCKNFKIVDQHLTSKGKRRVTFDNDRKNYNSTLFYR